MATESGTTAGITRSEFGDIAFERGNGKFYAVLPGGHIKEYDLDGVREDIQASIEVLDELQKGFDELEHAEKRAQRLAEAGLSDEFIEFNDEARDELIDNIAIRIEAFVERALGKNLDSSFLAGDLIDAVADAVVGFGR